MLSKFLCMSALCSGLFFSISNAQAADVTDGMSETLAVEKMICAKAYLPATGKNSPTYQAGISSEGKAVVPADINSAPSMTQAKISSDFIEVPMTIDLAKRMNLPQIGAEAEMPVANLRIYNSGRIEYNGQDISSQANSMCGVAQKSDTHDKANNIAKIEPAAGQDSMMAAPSVTMPQPTSDYVPDQVAPPEQMPLAGSVVRSSTSPEPVIEYKLQRGTVNKANIQMPQSQY
jgi:hypothetical protein